MIRYRYRLDRPFRWRSPHLLGIAHANRWVRIEDGEITISAGYAWDGCSPAIRLPGGTWLGPWDGPLGTDGRPVSWRASSDAPGWMCSLYPAAVHHLGPQEWGGLAPS